MSFLFFRLAVASELTPKVESPQPARDVGLQQELGVAVGARIPEVSLLDLSGSEVPLLTGRGPTVVVFYKGGWCPYCNGQLRDLALQYADFQARGLEVVAVSADTPEANVVTSATWEIPFPVLSDPDAVAIEAFEVGGRLNGMTRTMLKVVAGIDQPSWRGSRDGQTSLSGAFLVVDREVRWKHVESALKVRPSAQQLLDALPDVSVPGASVEAAY